jgi:hypothetical protein
VNLHLVAVSPPLIELRLRICGVAEPRFPVLLCRLEFVDDAYFVNSTIRTRKYNRRISLEHTAELSGPAHAAWMCLVQTSTTLEPIQPARLLGTDMTGKKK